MQKFKGSLAAIVHDVETVADLSGLREKSSVPGFKRLIFTQVFDFSLCFQFVCPVIDELRYLIDYWLQVLIGERVLGDKDTTGLKFFNLFGCQLHRVPPDLGRFDISLLPIR